MSIPFADLGVPQDLVSALARRSIENSFPIQAMTLPDALAGRDICGKAPTGSGKTLAFGLALLARLSPGPSRSRRPRSLILTPTRELCAQIAQELTPLARERGLRVAAFYGGTGYQPQIGALNRGVDVAVACPGRLGDLIERGVAKLDEIEVFVLDEADRMADMGFLPEVRRLLDQTPRTRQTLLFSATLDGDIDVLVRKYQTNPARHELEGNDADKSRAEHMFWKVDSAERAAVAAAVVGASGPTILFSRTKHGADRMTRQLEERGVRAVAIHGNRSQNQRERALAAFTKGHVDALVATDVAARGIHVDGVAAVVHLDPPADAKDYVHRSGRTARAGAIGVVVSFVGSDKVGFVKRLQRDLCMPTGTTAPNIASLQEFIPERVVREISPEGDSASSGFGDGRRSTGPRRGDSKVRSRAKRGGSGHGFGRPGSDRLGGDARPGRDRTPESPGSPQARRHTGGHGATGSGLGAKRGSTHRGARHQAGGRPPRRDGAAERA